MKERWKAEAGWAAIAMAALSLAQVAFEIGALSTAVGSVGPPRASSLVQLRLTELVQAAAFGLVVWRMAALISSRWMSRAGVAAGATGAAMLAVGAILALARLATRQAATPDILGYFAPVAIGFWMMVLGAADWRTRRLRPWLRVLGVTCGAILMIQPAVPELRILTLLLGLVWWPGLGIAMLSLSRSPLAEEEGPAGTVGA